MKIISDQEKAELGKDLAEHGISPSTHRLLILREIRSRQDHPSAEMLFQTLSVILPTLSKTTVYNTLSLFERCELISSLPLEGHEMRYDHDRSGTLHYYCLSCHRIMDPADEQSPILCPTPPAGFEIRQVQTVVKGYCPECLGRESRKSQSA